MIGLSSYSPTVVPSGTIACWQCAAPLPKLELYFRVDQSVIGWLLIQELALRINNVFDVGHGSRSLVIVFVVVPIFGVRFVGVVFIFVFDFWQVDGCAPSPLDQFVKNFALFNLGWAVDLVNLQWPNGATWDNVPVCLEDPLGHFVALTLGRSKDSAENFTIEGELGLLSPLVTPIVPAILAQIGDVTFGAGQQGVGIAAV
jgi:hypothetical protein